MLAVTKLPITFHDRRVLTLETAQDGKAWRWAVFNASDELLTSCGGLPNEAAALKAAKTCARQLFLVLIDGLRPVPP